MSSSSKPPTNVSNSNESLDDITATRYGIKFSIYGACYVGLVDTGATFSILDYTAFRKLHMNNLKVRFTDLKVRVANGNLVNVKFRVYLPVFISGKLHIVDFLVIDKLSKYEVILGMDFCKQFKLQIDCKNDVVKIGDEKVPIVDLDSASVEDGKDFFLDVPETVLSSEEEEQLNDLLAEYKDKFSLITGLSKAPEYELRVLPNSPVINKKQYYLNPCLVEEVRKEINRLLEAGYIEPSTSPYNSPIMLQQKSDKRYRFLCDLRGINSILEKDSFPIDHSETLFTNLREAKYLTHIDLVDSFFQIKLSKASRPLTSFSISSIGSFQYCSLPQGLCNSAQAFSRALHKVLEPVIGKKVYSFIDDCLIFTSGSFSDHLRDVREVLDLLLEAGLKINWNKCKFGRRYVQFLGFVLGNGERRCSPSKIKSIVNMAPPREIKALQSFLATCNFFRKHFPRYAEVSANLYKLLRKNEKFVWGPEQQESFLKMKSVLASDVVLALPDFNKQFILETDSSGYAILAVLSQILDGRKRVIAYFSRAMNKHEIRYDVHSQELLALHFGVMKSKFYVAASKHKLVCFTDNRSVTFLNSIKNPKNRICRLILDLNTVPMEVHHRKGTDNFIADCLSRCIEDNRENLEFDTPLKATIVSLDSNDIGHEFLDTKCDWYLQLRTKILASPKNFPNFFVKDDLIYKNIKNGNDLISVLVVPTDFREKLLLREHSSPTSGHRGLFKTLRSIRCKYFFPKMLEYVSQFIKKCQPCIEFKAVRKKEYGQIQPKYRTVGPGSILFVDYCGPFPRSLKGNQYIFIAVCQSSKYIFTYACRNANAETTKRCLTDIFFKAGVSELVVSDNAQIFRSNLMKEFAQQFGFVHKFTAAYSAESNRSERGIQSIKTALKMYCKDSHKSWDQYLSHVTFAYNNSDSESCRYSPNELWFGKKLRAPGDPYFVLRDSETREFEPVDHLEQLITQLEKIRKKASEFAFNANKRSCHHYNLRHRPLELREGQLVYRRNFVLSNKSKGFAASLAPKYVGPLTVQRKIRDNQYLLKDFLGKTFEVSAHHIRTIN